MSDAPFLIVGLGNPGPKYAGNRHNVGFMVADLLAERVGGSFKSHGRARAVVCQGRLTPGGPAVVLVKPLTFMNVSGQAVGPLATFFKVPNDRVVVVHDELDLPYGALKLRAGGGENGHNGLKSVSQALGGRDYLRAKFGVGRPPGRMDPAAFVLRDFSGAERAELPLFLEVTADAVAEIVTAGLAAAQNKYHADR